MEICKLAIVAEVMCCRYPVHFHMMGDTSFTSWVANCSIHDTWNRGVTIHGTHQVHVRHTTAFVTTGHTFFLEGRGGLCMRWHVAAVRKWREILCLISSGLLEAAVARSI